MAKSRACKACGKEFTPSKTNILYCSDVCRSNGARIGRQRRKSKQTPQGVRSIAELTMQAAALGLSYGQYVAQLAAERSEDGAH